eukprot:CAMPEP_0194102148 /NCGR_PEP_ID=MMETSP0150-20130528/2804_1 /TAXON_ID=122233 /ORGANISM="Chaetoceros debilis, Strain MM31A-1" /LENGTH=624 /DNA_ID=CAMNT_0038789019 /DNA_START=47 /DNA_END=1921 /DNA_ORIENTATION=-
MKNLAFKLLALSVLFGSAFTSNPEDNAVQFNERNLFNHPEAGENCLTDVDITCTLPNGLNCNILANISAEDCGITTLSYKFKWRNLNKSNDNNNIVLFNGRTVPKVQTAKISGFDKSIMFENETRVKVVKRDINTCNKGTANASFKLEGHVEGYSNGDGSVKSGYYCFAWKFLKVLIRQQREALTLSPVPAPTPPVSAQSPNLKLDMRCTFELQNNWLPCGSLVNIVILNTTMTRIRIRYSYVVTNKDYRDVKLQALIAGGENLLGNDSITLKAQQSHAINNIYEWINLSRPDGIGQINKDAIIIGAAAPNWVPGSATASNSFGLPAMPAQFSWGFPEIKCTYGNRSCQQYLNDFGCFTAEVDFQYKFRNTGFMCNSIDKVTVKFLTDPTPLAIDNRYQCADRNICPGETWTLSEKRLINTCSNDIENSTIVLQITTTTNSVTIDTSWSLREPIVTAPVTQPVIAPVTAPVTQPVTQPVTTYTNVQCAGSPTQVWFNFTGNSCPTTRNLKKSGSESRHSCDQVGDMGTYNSNNNYRVVVKGKYNSQKFFDSVVQKHQIISIADPDHYKLPTNSFVEVFDNNDSLVQLMTIHTSCSDTFFIGEEFGAVKLVGFDTPTQGQIPPNL